MQYYKIRGNSDPKVIGVKNGIYQGEVIWKKFQEKKTAVEIQEYFSIKRYKSNLNAIEPFGYSLEYVEACKSAKMTDFFCFSPVLWGIEFFVTNKTKKIFEQFKLPQHKYIPVKIYHKNIEYDYWAIYIPYSYRLDSIDFIKTTFFKGSELVGKQFIQFKNEVSWNSDRVFGVEQLCFNKNFDNSLDLFSSSFGGTGYYISERLKNGIEAAGLTGVVIREPKEPELIFE